MATSNSGSLRVPESEISWSDCHDVPASTSGRKTVVGKEMFLWEQLDKLLEFVLKLKKWNEKSRPLHAKGLQQIERCLETLVHFRNLLQQQGGGEADRIVLVSVLSTCWNRYSILMLLESSTVHLDSRVLLQQWLEGLQHSMQMEEQEEGNDTFHNTTRKADEIRMFFLTCLALLLGRLAGVEMESLVQDFGAELLHALFGQLRAKDAEVVDLAVAILRTLLFHTQLANPSLLRMEAIAPSLIDLLDEKDSTSRAIVVLIADYFAINPGAPELEKLFGILGAGNTAQRQNALCVISELLKSLSSLEDKLIYTVRQNVAIHLLKRLGDVELTNRIEVAQLFAKLDPQFVLPALIQHLYSRDEKVRSAASASIVSVLKGHHNQCAVVSVLLDCSSNMIRNAVSPVNPGQIGISTSGVSSPDVGRIMRLIPAWANEVKGWNHLIEVILQKAFADPSNPVMPSFLSQISGHLSDNVQAVFKHVMAFMDEQAKMTEDLVVNSRKGDSSQPQGRLDTVIFERLSPLLVLKVLHLKDFNDASCSELYGSGSGNPCEERCITRFLIERACGDFESHDIRKLSAELLGRLLPRIILPLLTKQLEHAVENQHRLQARSCIFALCSSLWLRGKASLYHRSMVHIQGLLVQVLLQPCLSTDEETFKTQHGCIDCFAMMICAELASANDDSGSDFIQPLIFQNDDLALIEELHEDAGLKRHNGSYPQVDHSILSSVISCIIGQQQNVPFLPSLQWSAVEIHSSKTAERTVQDLTIQSAFRLCMANVLISATQKIAMREKQLFVSQMVPPIMRFVQVGMDTEIKTACLQILFTAVHHLKETIIPYAIDLFNLSLGILRRKGSAEERMAAARLMAALLSSDDHITREMVPYLSEAFMTLESISRMDSSSELRAFCERLLNCMMPPNSVMQPF